MAPLSDPEVGLVTCLYRGIANETLGSRLESLGISTDFSAGVLVAQLVESGIKFGLGSTLAFRRRDLQAIGGFESLVDYLADDYQLGSRIAGVGTESKVIRRCGRDIPAAIHAARFLGSPSALGAHNSRFTLLGLRRHWE